MFIVVPKTDMFLGYVVDILLSTVLGADLDIATKTKVLKAFNKIVWIQNDRKSWIAIISCANQSHTVLSFLSALLRESHV